jgi:hypothetical protein
MVETAKGVLWAGCMRRKAFETVSSAPAVTQCEHVKVAKRSCGRSWFQDEQASFGGRTDLSVVKSNWLGVIFFDELSNDYQNRFGTAKRYLRRKLSICSWVLFVGKFLVQCLRTGPRYLSLLQTWRSLCERRNLSPAFCDGRRLEGILYGRTCRLTSFTKWLIRARNSAGIPSGIHEDCGLNCISSIEILSFWPEKWQYSKQSRWKRCKLIVSEPRKIRWNGSQVLEGNELLVELVH